VKKKEGRNREREGGRQRGSDSKREGGEK